MPLPFSQDTDPNPLTDGSSDAPTPPFGTSRVVSTPPPPPPPPPPPLGTAPVYPRQPPYGSPPAGPPAWGPPPPPAPPPRPRPSHGAGWVIASVLAAVLLLAGSVLIGYRAGTAQSTGAPNASAPLQDLSPGPSGSSGQGPASPSVPPSPNAPTTPTDWTQVAAAIDPGVVNIESRMTGGIGAGTGMVLTADGEILTNNHVVDGATAIQVTVSTTGDRYRASVVGTDPAEDVAVLRLDGASGLDTIPIGDSSSVRVGDQVAAIGNAGGQGGDPAVAVGSVVGLDQTITATDSNGSNAETLTGLIQVEADVVPGDSGGPLADRSGKVVGMDTAASAGRARFRTSQNQAFAIPINHALEVAKGLESGGGSSGGSSGSSGTTQGRALLGVQVTTGDSGGALVDSAQQGSPAAAAGIVAGDLIIGADGSQVTDASDLVSTLASHKPGDKVTVVWQDQRGRQHQATIVLASR